MPPLFVIEFLHRVVDTFEDYFSDCSENVVKDNYVVVYEVSLYHIKFFLFIVYWSMFFSF